MFLSSAELYDPTSGTWSSTGNLSAPRNEYSVALLPNGKVLVVGGFNGTGSLSSAELYDPASGMWSSTSSLSATYAAITPRRCCLMARCWSLEDIT